MQQTGFFWHVHHGELVEYCHSYDERVSYIRKEKPKEQIDLRIRLLQPVKGDLPKEVVKAGLAHDEARQAYDEAERAYDKARLAGRTYDEEKQAYVETGRAYDETRLAYYQAVRRNKKKIKALHAKECPDCPWDGHTIFPDNPDY